MKKLNKEQVEILFDFVKSKYVRYIDIQHELVDHLASDIEIEMEDNKELSFSTALQKAYSKFPITGFSTVVSQRESAMNRYWMKSIFLEFAYKGGLPFLIILTGMTFLNYQLIMSFGTIVFYILLIFILLSGYGSIIGLRSIIKSQKRNADGDYLVISIFKSWATAFSFVPIIASQYFSDFKWVYHITPDMIAEVLVFSILFSLSYIWNMMAYYRFPSLIRTELKSKYAHLNLSI